MSCRTTLDYDIVIHLRQSKYLLWPATCLCAKRSFLFLMRIKAPDFFAFHTHLYHKITLNFISDEIGNSQFKKSLCNEKFKVHINGNFRSGPLLFVFSWGVLINFLIFHYYFSFYVFLKIPLSYFFDKLWDCSWCWGKTLTKLIPIYVLAPTRKFVFLAPLIKLSLN